MNSSERGMSPVAMTIINHWKEYWPGSNQQPPVLKYATLLTELWGLAGDNMNVHLTTQIFNWSDVTVVEDNTNLSQMMGFVFPEQQILDFSKLKEFADYNFKLDEHGRKFSKRVENTVGNGEIAP